MPPTSTPDEYAVLFPRNGMQDVHLKKCFFLPRFFLTARGRHHILVCSNERCNPVWQGRGWITPSG